jgi:hypothetical protein
MIMKIDKAFTIGALIGWFIISPILIPKYFSSLIYGLIWVILGIVWSIMLGSLVYTLQEYYKNKKKLDELKIEIKVLERLMKRQEKRKNELLSERQKLLLKLGEKKK